MGFFRNWSGRQGGTGKEILKDAPSRLLFLRTMTPFFAEWSSKGGGGEEVKLLETQQRCARVETVHNFPVVYTCNNMRKKRIAFAFFLQKLS